ncbi:MAG: PD-(D/E)XK nuclease family protein [Cyanobacteria bacterium P01_F01_bin.3]
MTSPIKLSPSKLTFLYEDCKRCWWLDAYGVWKRPYTPFPSIFNSIDKVMRGAYAGQSSQLISSDLPEGVIETKSKRSQSTPVIVDAPIHVFFSGQIDARVQFEDGTQAIVDFKTSQPKPQNVELYRRQLMAYAYMYLMPGKGVPIETSQMGLVCVTPSDFQVTDSSVANMEMSVTYQSIPIDWEWWDTFCMELVTLLSGDEPDGKPDCPYCAMQRATMAIL